jgi:uncharacterized protein YggU (UPF0235/DUF167 family)
MPSIPLWVRPASGRDAVAWDPWRKRWVVYCRAPAIAGAANHAVAGLMADWLGVPASTVRWVQSGTSRAKALFVDGITDAQIAERLSSHVAAEQAT